MVTALSVGGNGMVTSLSVGFGLAPMIIDPPGVCTYVRMHVCTYVRICTYVLPVRMYVCTYVRTGGGSIIVGEGFIRRFVYWFIRRQPVYP